MGSEVLILVITNIVAPIITGTVTWVQAKRKYNTEVDTSIIDNMKQSLEFYKTLSDDNKARIDEYSAQNAELQREMAELRKQFLNLTLNICLDFTCKHRVQEDKEQLKQRLKDDNIIEGRTIEELETNKPTKDE